MSAFEYEIFRGDDVPILLTVTLDGEPFDLTGSGIFFTLKRDPGEADADALVAYELGDGITLLDADGGTAIISLARSDTENLPPGEVVYGDAQVVATDSRVFTVAAGTLYVKHDITRRIS